MFLMWTAQEIKALLEQVERADPDRRVFGSSHHHYRLHATRPEVTVQALEQENGIIFPSDYRDFVLHVGDGGAGPSYGLDYLTNAARDSDLRQPFPLTESSEALEDGRLEELIGSDQYTGVPGGLALGHQGCGIYTWLIVNGATYGTIWEGRDDFYPTGLSFWQWYEKWLIHLRDHTLPTLDNESSIDGVEVGMHLAEVTKRSGLIGKSRFVWATSFKNEIAVVRFEGLATGFGVDAQDRIVRLIKHSI
jgi:hypothetical protein